MRVIMVGPNPIWMVSQEEEEIRTHERCQKHRKCHVSTEREGANPRRGVSGEANFADTLILHFQFPELWENKFLLFNPSSLWYIVMEALST